MVGQIDREFRVGWKILLIALLGVITSPHYLGLYSFGSLVQDLKSTLDIPIGELQRAITFNFVGIAIGSQLAGWLLGRFEQRSVILWSLLLFSALYATLGIIDLTRNTLYLFYFILPLAGSGALLVTWTQIACQNFEKNRGMALAIILTGGGIISTAAPLLLSTVVGTEHWQNAFFILALMPMLTFLVCFFALPKTAKAQSESNNLSQVEEASQFGLSFAEILRSWRFWIIITASVLVIFVILSLITNIVPLLVEKGLSQTKANTIYSAFGLSLIVGRLLGGFFIDRIWGPLVAFSVMILPAFSCLLFLLAPAHTPYMILATVLVGFAAGAEYDILAYLISRYFGLKAYGKAYGALIAITTLGSGMAPLIYGPILDAAGNYNLLLMLGSGTVFVAVPLFLTLGSYPVFQKSIKPAHSELSS